MNSCGTLFLALKAIGLEFEGQRVAPQNAKARNIAFDVTPNRLITGIVTENGVAYPPFDVSLKKLVKKIPDKMPIQKLYIHKTS